MRIIISPAKKMHTQHDFLPPKEHPVFLDKAIVLATYLKTLSYEALKALLCCNDEIATLNYDRYQKMDLLSGQANPALLSYEGIQYKYMAPQIFEDSYYEYVQNHLRILSGLYGILRPFDAIVPYRLEMQTKLKTSFCKNLYDYWKDSIYQELSKDNDIILNLASTEYSKVVQKYLEPSMNYITCTFGEIKGNKILEKGVYVKMARGEMVRFMAENNIEDLEGIKAFDRLGFHFSSEHSTATQFVFLSTPSASRQLEC